MPVFIPGPPPAPRKKDRGGFGGFLSNAVGDVPQLARSLFIDLPAAAGRGVGHSAADISRGEFGETAQRLGRTGRGILQGTETILPDIPSLPYSDVQLVGYDPKKGWDFFFKDKDLTKQGKEDFLDALYDDPLISLLNVLPVAGAATKVGSVGSLASKIKKANPHLTVGDSLRYASMESRNPGILKAAHGMEGGIGPRRLDIKIPGGGSKSTTLPRSSSALGRGIESLYDASSRHVFPISVGSHAVGKGLTESARGARFERRQLHERLRQSEAEAALLAEPIRKAAYRYGDFKDRLMGELQRTPQGTALVAALQLPRQMSYRDGLEAYVKSRDAILTDGPFLRKVHTTLDEILDDGGEKALSTWVGNKAALGAPNERPLWEITSLDKDGAILTRGNETLLADLGEVFPLKPEGNGTYGAPFRENTPLDEVSEAFIRSEVADIRRALDHPTNEQEFAQAMKSMEALSDKVNDLGLQIAGRGLDEKGRINLKRRYDRRRDLLISDLIARGLVPEDSTARGYFPHYSVFKSLSSTFGAPVRLPASGAVIGVPRAAEAVRGHRNNMVLSQTGQALMDPAALMHLLAMRIRFMETFAERKDFYSIAAEKIPQGEGGYLIRDPEVAAKAISARTKAELDMSDEEWSALVIRGEDTASKMDNPEVVNSQPLDWIAPTKIRPDWYGEEGVRWLPEEVVEGRFGRRVFQGQAPSTLGMSNALARLTLIVGRPLRYAWSNIPSNVIMLLATNPEALPMALKLLRSQARQPEVIQRIASEMGEVRATAGIPRFDTRRQTRSERTEEWAGRQSSRMGGWLGAYVDQPFRVAAWMGRAKRAGLSERDFMEVLQAKKGDPMWETRQALRQRARDDMLDFDSMTAWEREQGVRYLFVLPFLRAALKWPAVYARERPIITGLAASLAEAQPNVGLPLPEGVMQGGTSSEVEIGGKRFDLSAMNPLSPISEIAGSAQALGQGDLSAAGQYLTPGLQLGTDISSGGVSGNDALVRALGSFLPVVGAPAAATISKGFNQAFMEEVLRYAPKQPYRSIRADKASEMDSIIDAYGSEVLANPWVADSLDAYWMYRDLTARARHGIEENYGRGKLNPEEERAILGMVWSRHYEEAFPPVEASEESNERIKKIMFGWRDKLARGLPE